MAIPKVIHYCWYGNGAYSDEMNKCLMSWSRYCPNYEIIRWDESNTNLEENTFVKQAYQSGMYAFVADYVRLKVLYLYGGIYMDTDVELVRSLDDLLGNTAFSGFESDSTVQTGLIASTARTPVFRNLLQYYEKRHFIARNGQMDTTTNVTIMTAYFQQNGLQPNNQQQTICGIVFYPKDWFCPKDWETRIVNITKNTYAIHHFKESWRTKAEKNHTILQGKLAKKYGKTVGKLISYFPYAVDIFRENSIKQGVRFIFHKVKKKLSS